MNLNTALQYLTAAVTVASIVANFVPPNTWVGKGLHWVALNIRPLLPADTSSAPPPPPAQG